MVSVVKIIILEARSMSVRYAESTYSPGGLQILSDNLAVVLALCKRRSKKFTLLSDMRRIFASGFRARFVLSFRWIPSELIHSDKGNRFCDRDDDPSKSLLHVLPQRLPRFLHAQTGDKESFLPALMQLDDGEVDRKPRVTLSALSVQSRTHTVR